jgi:hypothetical protein
MNHEKGRHGSLLQEPPIKGASLLELLGLGIPLSLDPLPKSPASQDDNRFRSGPFSNGPSVWRYNSSRGFYAPNFRD